MTNDDFEFVGNIPGLMRSASANVSSWPVRRGSREDPLQPTFPAGPSVEAAVSAPCDFSNASSLGSIQIRCRHVTTECVQFRLIPIAPEQDDAYDAGYPPGSLRADPSWRAVGDHRPSAAMRCCSARVSTPAGLPGRASMPQHSTTAPSSLLAAKMPPA